MSCQGSSRGRSVSLNLVKLERGWPLSIASLLSLVSFPNNHLSVAFPAVDDTKHPQPKLLLQDSAYSCRVWITLIKLLYALIQGGVFGPDIHQSATLCGRLLPSAPLVSEKNSSRKFSCHKKG